MSFHLSALFIGKDMASFRYLNALFWRHWLRRRGVKSSGDLHTLRKKAVLQVAEGVTIARVRLESRDLSVGALIYIRSGSELFNISRIGRFCSIGNGVILGQGKATHPLDWVSTHSFQFTDSRFPYYEGGIAPAGLGAHRKGRLSAHEPKSPGLS